MSPVEVDRLQELLEVSGARARVEQEVATLGAQAMDALSDLQVPGLVRAGLGELAQRILRRRS